MDLMAVKRSLMNQFREAGLDTPDLDTRLFLMAATGFSHSDIIARGRESVSADTLKVLGDYAGRRIAGEPVDHILGYREFYGRRFSISKDVLSPRPETEMLVDAAVTILENRPTARILDLGTGTGAIVISILAEAKHVQGVAVDVSKKALEIATENAKTHKVEARLTLLEGSWFSSVEGQFDIILSNPPYITAAAMEDLDIEVKGFDPDLALSGGEDGLMAYRAIISQADKHLKAGGVLLFEIGYDQGQSVSELLTLAGFTDVSVHKDLSGHDRMIKAVIKQ